jgi:oxygen-independent coproporphyrinogen-3 oxidase
MEADPKTKSAAAQVNHGSLPGLYVHVPFCRGKCAYCDFYSVGDLSLIPAWRKAVEQEILYHAGTFAPFDSLYLGGGTPSVLAEADLAALMEAIHRHFSLGPASEITMEINPEDADFEKLHGYRRLGINRLSIGVQSFDDEELRFLGRRHNARQAQKALLWARAAGFDNLNLDLIYGLPGQTLTGWEKTLAAALAFRPEHLSCYQLTVEPGTALARRTSGRPLVSEEKEREFFLFTGEYLEGAGFFHYEISNFARGEGNYCRHNLKYWQRQPYLGLGPAAHSFDGRKRWWNHRSLADWLEALNRGELPAAGEEVLTPEQVRLERLLLGFRTKRGVEFGHLAGDRWQENLADLASRGWLKVEEGRAVPTLQGYLLADRLPLYFT